MRASDITEIKHCGMLNHNQHHDAIALRKFVLKASNFDKCEQLIDKQVGVGSGETLISSFYCFIGTITWQSEATIKDLNQPLYLLPTTVDRTLTHTALRSNILVYLIILRA